MFDQLIHGWGGQLGAGLANTPEGEQLFRQMESVDIRNVRILIKRLMSKVTYINECKCLWLLPNKLLTLTREVQIVSLKAMPIVKLLVKSVYLAGLRNQIHFTLCL
jgi:hypothetical protein